MSAADDKARITLKPDKDWKVVTEIPDKSWHRWGRNRKPLTLHDEHGKGPTIEVPEGKGTIFVPKARLAEILSMYKGEQEPVTTANIPIRIVVDDRVKEPKTKPKREPLMADRLLASKFLPDVLLPKKDQQRIRGYLMEAKRFVLDAAATQFMAEFVNEHHDIIVRDHEFAMPPFKNMYVEIPFELYYKSLTGRDPDQFADTRVGYLFRWPQVYIITESTKENVHSRIYPSQQGMWVWPSIMPWYYSMNLPFSPEQAVETMRKMDIPDVGLDMFYWGETYDKLSDEDKRLLRDHHSMWMINDQFAETPQGRGIWKNTYETSAGDVRNIVVLMMLLTRTNAVRLEQEVPSMTAMIKNKVATYLRHSTVTFKLNPIPVLRRAGTSPTGIWRREHNVAGHYCHDKIARATHDSPTGTCARDAMGIPTHAWVEVDVNEWRCTVCKGKRWWRRECKRGSRDKGIVQTEYQVTE